MNPPSGKYASMNLQSFHAVCSLSVCSLVCALLQGILVSEGIAAETAPSAGILKVNVAASPLVVRSPGTERHQIVVAAESTGLTNVVVRLESPAWPSALVQKVVQWPKGSQWMEFDVLPLTAGIPVTVRIESSGGQGQWGPFQVEPPRRWIVYLTQHTHTDIGYTRPQTEILPEHLRYLDYALDYCDLTDGLPDDARFRWTCETAWAVREYLKGRPKHQIRRLQKRIQEGRIEVCGLLLNMSEIATENALAALVRPLRELKDAYGIPVRTAMQNDVNGAGWCLPDYFSGIGIRYLSMGINQTRSILPFDKPTPFWWESPSGKRVLAYRSDHYMTANFWGLEKGNLDRVRPEVLKYLLSLEHRGYPLDRVGVQFSGYFTDNSPPSTAACELVRRWNETFLWPRLRLSTAHEFLAYVESNHATSLPVHRQAWPDWWTDGFGSAARETAAARETETAMQANYALLAMASVQGAEIPPRLMDRAAEIQDELLFYHEHTYGAAESISDPLAENTQVQWGEKASYVWTAVKAAHLLREDAFGLLQDFLPRQETPTLAVFNTLNWPRSGLIRVFIDHEILPPDRQFQILDGTEPVLTQEMERRTEGTYWAIWVRNVPAFGYKVLRLETSSQPRPPATPSRETLRLDNAFYQIVLDPQNGAVRNWLDKESGRELVDQAASWKLGQCLYETMPVNREMKTNVFQRTSVRQVNIKPGANGPIWKSLLVTADMDGCATNPGIRAEIRLFEPEKRLELHYAVRKLSIPTPESVYVAFPFYSPDSQMLYEAQGGLVIPGRDQIPGSSSDWQTLQSFIAIRSPQGQILHGSDQAPLVQLGDFNLGKWQPVTRVERPHLYSWVMNNYWFTNFRTEQEGEFKWHYYLTSTQDSSRTAATRFGWSSRVPLLSRVLPPQKTNPRRAPSSRSLLAISAPNVVVVEARPARNGGGLFLQFREIEGQPTALPVSALFPGIRSGRVDEVNILEEPIRKDLRVLAMAPYEVKCLEVRRKSSRAQ